MLDLQDAETTKGSFQGTSSSTAYSYNQSAAPPVEDSKIMPSQLIEDNNIIDQTQVEVEDDLFRGIIFETPDQLASKRMDIINQVLSSTRRLFSMCATMMCALKSHGFSQPDCLIRQILIFVTQ